MDLEERGEERECSGSLVMRPPEVGGDMLPALPCIGYACPAAALLHYNGNDGVCALPDILADGERAILLALLLEQVLW
jgi:hypothetical protein